MSTSSSSLCNGFPIFALCIDFNAMAQLEHKTKQMTKNSRAMTSFQRPRSGQFYMLFLDIHAQKQKKPPQKWGGCVSKEALKTKG